jgi:hypothetical protein
MYGVASCSSMAIMGIPRSAVAVSTAHLLRLTNQSCCIICSQKVTLWLFHQIEWASEPRFQLTPALSAVMKKSIHGNFLAIRYWYCATLLHSYPSTSTTRAMAAKCSSERTACARAPIALNRSRDAMKATMIADLTIQQRRKRVKPDVFSIERVQIYELQRGVCTCELSWTSRYSYEALCEAPFD